MYLGISSKKKGGKNNEHIEVFKDLFKQIKIARV